MVFTNRMFMFLAAAALVSSPQSVAAQSYAVVDLGVSNGIARGINDPGDVVGVGSFGSANRGFVWSDGGAMPLPDLSSCSPSLPCSDARAINPARSIAGIAQIAQTGCNSLHAVAWYDASSAPTDLGTLTGLCSTFSAALGINSAGDIVGESGVAIGCGSHATLWPNDGTGPVDLGLLQASGCFSQARAISASGDVVGFSEITPGFNRGFLWQRGRMTALLPLNGGLASEAIGINGRGDVVGASQVPGDVRAVVWRRGSTAAVDLAVGGIAGTSFLYANAINDRGDIVGQMQVGGESHAFIVPQRGTLQDLNSLIGPSDQDWVIQIALGINNRGEIVGFGHPIGQLESRAVLLVPR